jgi:hypothetical protein
MKQLLLFLLLLAAPLFAQTAVSGAVVDPNGNPYANGTVSAFSTGNTGQPSSSSGPFALSSLGAFTITLNTNTYVFTVCAPPVNLGPTVNLTPKQICFNSPPIAISGGVQDVSGNLNAVAVSLGPRPPVTPTTGTGQWLYASTQTGTFASDKINTAITALNALGGGTIYADFVGAQTIHSNIVLGPNIHLVLGCGLTLSPDAINLGIVLGNAVDQSNIRVSGCGESSILDFSGQGSSGNNAHVRCNATNRCGSNLRIDHFNIKGNRLAVSGSISAASNDGAGGHGTITVSGVGNITNNGTVYVNNVNPSTYNCQNCAITSSTPTTITYNCPTCNGAVYIAGGNYEAPSSACTLLAQNNSVQSGVYIEDMRFQQCGAIGAHVQSMSDVHLRRNRFDQTMSPAIQMNCSIAAARCMQWEAADNVLWDDDVVDVSGSALLNIINTGAASITQGIVLKGNHVINDILGSTKTTADDVCNHKADATATGCGQLIEINGALDLDVIDNVMRLTNHECISVLNGGAGHINISNNIMSLCGANVGGTPALVTTAGAGAIELFAGVGAPTLTQGFTNIIGNNVYDSGYCIALQLGNAITDDTHIMANVLASGNNCHSVSQPIVRGIFVTNLTGASACGGATRKCNWATQNVNLIGNIISNGTANCNGGGANHCFLSLGLQSGTSDERNTLGASCANPGSCAIQVLDNTLGLGGGVGAVCSSSGGTCGDASEGSFSMAAAATTATVTTTQVGTNSQILITEDMTLGTRLSVTCNTTQGRTYAVTTRTAGTSFIITASAAPAANPACLSFKIIN